MDWDEPVLLVFGFTAAAATMDMNHIVVEIYIPPGKLSQFPNSHAGEGKGGGRPLHQRGRILLADELPLHDLAVTAKNLSVERGEQVLFDEIRYFFYITNDRISSAAQIVRRANQRCNQENLIEQLKNGVRALRMPVDNLVSNWAYMVMASLAWTLKAWFALWLPETGRWSRKHQAEKQTVLRMEFKKFRHAFIALSCQIVRSGRRILYRLLSWNQWLRVFFRGVAPLRLPLRC